MILAVDASADTEFYCTFHSAGPNLPLGPLTFAPLGFAGPNGTSLIATAERARDYSNGFFDFPPIPGSGSDFVAQGLNTRPTFFGCNITTSGNMSEMGNYPLVVYLPNAPSLQADGFLTNTSTFKLSYEDEETVAFLDAAQENGIKGFQTGGESRDAEWPLALKCATVDRARTRAGLARSEKCEALFSKCESTVADSLIASLELAADPRLLLTSLSPPSPLLYPNDADCWSDGIAEQLTNYTASTGGNLGNTGGGSGGESAASTLSVGAGFGAALLAVVASVMLA